MNKPGFFQETIEMELPQVGRHCQLEGCNSLDFLPVACPLCQHIFCGDHRLPLSHNCTDWKRVSNELIQCDVCERLLKPTNNKTPKEALEEHKNSSCQLYLYSTTVTDKINRECHVTGCKDIDPRVGPVHCNGCDHDFCLKHRHPSSHDCTSLNNDEQKKLDRKLAAQEKLAKTFVPPIKKKKVIQSVPVKSKNGGMVELMKIKQQAKGSANVPLTVRLYIYVQCPKESKTSSLILYFDKKNTVGRALDMIADMCQVNNKNNVLPASDPQRLELYKCPDMTVLNKSDTLESALKNLDTILLERQGELSMVDEM